MKRILLGLLMLLCWRGLAYADNSVMLSLSDGTPGDTVTVQVSMVVSDRVVAAEFSVPIIEGLSYVPGSFTAQITGMSSSSTFLNDDLRVYFYSTDLDNNQLCSGNIFSFKVCLGRTPGTFTILPSVILSDVDGKPISVNVTGADITVLAPQIVISPETIDFGHVAIRSTYTKTFGVTNTGTMPLNVTSVTSSTMELTVSETSFTIPSGATRQLQINYLPLATGLQEMTLTFESDAVDNNKSIKTVVSDAYSVNEIIVDNSIGESDSVISVGLSLANMEDIAALQCSFVLPEGVSYVDNSFVPSDRLKDMKTFSSVANGMLKLYVYSESDELISEGSGSVGSFKIHLGSSNGIYTLVPEDVILGNRDLVNVLSGVVNGSIEILGPIMVCDTVLDMGVSPLTDGATAIFPIQNIGKKELVIDRIVFDDSLISLNCECPIIISPESQMDLEVSYKPVISGDYASIMRLYTNVPDYRILDVGIEGSIFEPNYITSDIRINSDRKSGSLSISLSNYNNVTAIQMNVYGLEEMTVDKTSLCLTDRSSGLTPVLTLNDDGSVKVFLYSLDNRCFSGNSGELFSFSFSGNKVLDNSLSVRIADIVISDENGKDISSSNSMIASVEEPVPLSGDANCDGKVDVADITSVVNYIYGQQTDGFNVFNADVNSNQVINVSDISGIISIISGNNQ